MEWVHLSVTVVASLTAAWLGARVGAKATRQATSATLEHDVRTRAHDRTLEAAEKLLDHLGDDVYTYRPRWRSRPHGVAPQRVRRPLMRASYYLANRAYAQDAALAHLCHEFAGVMGRGATYADVFTANRVMSGAVTLWIRRRETFLEQEWTLADYHLDAHLEGAEQVPPRLITHPLWIAPPADDAPPDAGHSA